MATWTYEKPDNLVEMFENAVTCWPQNNMYGVKSKDGKSLLWNTYGQIGKRVDNLRAGLASLGVRRGDAVGLIANNRPEWAIAAFATYGLGARFVPMYEAELTKVWKYIITDASVKVLLVSKPEILAKVNEFKTEIPTLEHIFLLTGDGEHSMAALEAAGAKNPAPSIRPSPEDVAVLIYTSGTTGEPKGVLLTHGNLTSNVLAGNRNFAGWFDTESRSISILPWAHSMGQVAELYNWLLFGGSIAFMEKVDTLADDMALIKPTFMIAVPRVFNKVYDKLWAKMKDEGGLKLKLFRNAVAAAKKKRELEAEGKSSPFVNLKAKFYDKLVFSKIRDRFGGRLKGALTGSATMNVEIGNFFCDIGIPTFDAYGLTETSPAVTMNSPNAKKPGSVGRPIDKVKVVIDREAVGGGDTVDGEIVVYGPNVMMGYNNKPKETSAVITADGGFRTGDRGRLDNDGFLFITGRIKEQYKLENGKYVFPVAIEEEIKLAPSIANVMVFGEGKPYNVCLAYPDPAIMEKWARENNLPTDVIELLKTKAAKDHMVSEIKLMLKDKFGSYEIPMKFHFITEDFTLENGMLTQTMKLKRRAVVDRYREELEGMYKSRE